MFKCISHPFDIVIQKPVAAVFVKKTDILRGFADYIDAAVVIRMEQKMAVGIEEKYGGR